MGVGIKVMILHFLNYFFLLLISLFSSKRNYTFFIFIFFLYLSFIDGTRYETYYDWTSYKLHFYFSKGSQTMELGYNIVIDFIKKIMNYNTFLFLVSFLLYMVGFKNIYKIAKNRITYIVLFSLVSPFIGINRQLIAIIILTFSLKYILLKKRNRFLLIVCVASLFHVSSILILPIYYINKIRIKYSKKTLIYIIISAISVIYLKNIVLEIINLLALYVDFFKKFLFYFKSSSENKMTFFPLLLRNLELFLPIFFVLKEKKLRQNKVIDLGFKGVLYGYLIYLLSYGTFQILIRALLTIKMLFMPLLYAETLNVIDNKKKRTIVTLILITLLTFSLFKALLGPYKQQYIYKNIFISQEN